jgi:hypothetical protein
MQGVIAKLAVPQRETNVSRKVFELLSCRTRQAVTRT